MVEEDARTGGRERVDVYSQDEERYVHWYSAALSDWVDLSRVLRTVEVTAALQHERQVSIWNGVGIGLGVCRG